ncbi:HlyD family efflux transporter periplasmic adaptor subunit [Bacteroides sp.]|uniref:HlyD family efflux transporter periplasmic adaptor subunit n=1 Tax=Bacteroides sp. TaxID=29523 RepID=UPI00260D3835|nr:HlyD family efflux transporter periplasmic adaptor subunit [Bacteroides sp.]MDD3038232.1 HlyD family efflux transporter periplasmic adaptor subunit [Bacteroides sp.]
METLEKKETQKLEKKDSQRSEEVQVIIDRMPTRNATYAIILTMLLIVIIITLGFIIKYPDTVDGQISITSRLAPVRLIANISGKLHLLIDNKASIKEGQIIAYIDNQANYKDVLLVDSLLNRYKDQDLENFPIITGLLLGEISSTFNSFVIAHTQYYRMLHSDIYKTMCNSLHQQNNINVDIIENLNKEIILKENKLTIEKELLSRDSTLACAKALSEQEYNRQQSIFYDLQSIHKELHNSKLSYLAQIKRNDQQIQQYILEEQESLDKLKEELSVCKSQLINIIHSWKKTYLQISPIDGQIEYLGFWRENYFTQSGQELFSILPSQNEVIGEVIVPSYGIGKVKVGQIANVKVNNYPYLEYGLIKGEVSSISRLSNKIKQSSSGTTGEGNVYRVLITFPSGLQTNFGKTLNLDFESQGTAEIITRPKRLIERLFDNLKANAEQ